MTQRFATTRLGSRQRAFFLGAIILQLLALGSQAMRAAFREDGKELVFNGQGRAVLHNEPLAIFGYFSLVVAGILALIWYGRPPKAPTGTSDGAGLDFAVLAALVALLVMNGAAIIMSPGAWTLPYFIVALLIASGTLTAAKVRRRPV